MDVINNILTIGTLILTLVPIIYNVIKLLSLTTNNQAIDILYKRATIIVEGLEQLRELTPQDKKREAVNKLVNFATELGINITSDQVDDYIEQSVYEMNKVKRNVKN